MEWSDTCENVGYVDSCWNHWVRCGLYASFLRILIEYFTEHEIEITSRELSQTCFLIINFQIYPSAMFLWLIPPAYREEPYSKAKKKIWQLKLINSFWIFMNTSLPLINVWLFWPPLKKKAHIIRGKLFDPFWWYKNEKKRTLIRGTH